MLSRQSRQIMHNTRLTCLSVRESRTYFSRNSVTYLLERSSFSVGLPFPLLLLVFAEDSSSFEASEVSETVVSVSDPGSERNDGLLAMASASLTSLTETSTKDSVSLWVSDTVEDLPSCRTASEVGVSEASLSSEIVEAFGDGELVVG